MRTQQRLKELHARVTRAREIIQQARQLLVYDQKKEKIVNKMNEALRELSD